MVWRALFAAYYCDILMILLDQIRPIEATKGDAQKVWDKWIDKLSTEMKAGKHLTIGTMKKNFHKICEDFSKVETTGEKKERIGKQVKGSPRWAGRTIWRLRPSFGRMWGRRRRCMSCSLPIRRRLPRG